MVGIKDTISNLDGKKIVLIDVDKTIMKRNLGSKPFPDAITKIKDWLMDENVEVIINSGRWKGFLTKLLKRDLKALGFSESKDFRITTRKFGQDYYEFKKSRIKHYCSPARMRKKNQSNCIVLDNNYRVIELARRYSSNSRKSKGRVKAILINSNDWWKFV